MTVGEVSSSRPSLRAGPSLALGINSAIVAISARSSASVHAYMSIALVDSPDRHGIRSTDVTLPLNGEQAMESGLKGHEPLYLKYRPQQLADLVGQPAVVRTLTNAIAHDRLSHAYLFTGPRGTGKTSTARILAKSLNCEKGPTATPCLKCTQCHEIRLGTSPAVFEIDAASNNSVDDARVLIERAPLVAVGGRFKLYIIDECHMLTKEAFNALLKTIEEPPPQVVFVLATTEEHKVPPTIVSRCQRLMFRLVSQEDLSKHLRDIAAKEKIEIEEEPIKVIARRSGGGLRDALGLLDQSSLLAAPGKPVNLNDLLLLMGALQEDVLLEISDWILQRQGERVLSGVSRLLMEGREPSQLAMELARHFLNLMKASYVLEPPAGADDMVGQLIIGSPDYIAGLREQAGSFDRSELSQMVEQLNRLEQTCRRTTQPALHLEIGLLSLCHRHDMVIVRQIDERLGELEDAVRSGTVHHRPPAVQRSPARQGTVPQKEPARAEAKTVVPSISEEAQVGPAGIAGVAQFVQQTWATAADALAGNAGQGESAKQIGPDLAAEQAGEQTVEEPDEPAKAPPAVADGSVERARPLPAATDEASATPTSAEDELEAFWLQLLDEVASMPSILGILSNYPFPLSLDQKEFTIGVNNDMWRNNVEKRMEPIKTACERILGRQIAVKVKVVSGVPSRLTARDRGGAPSVRGAEEGAGAEESEEPEPATRAATTAQRTAPEASDLQASRGGGNNSNLVREADQLFQGPGSRRIT